MPDKPIPNKPAIAASEERFRALVTATSDVIYGLSADWSVMYELDGRGFLKDTNEPITDWQSRNIYPADLEKVQAAIAEAIRKKKMFQLEHRVLRIDDTPGWTFSRAVPILNDKGEITEWFGAASDITERKEAEEALRVTREQAEQQRRHYEAITSGTPDLMYIFDLDYRFTYANSALLTMWGKTWDNAIGKNLLENGYEPWHAEMHEREIDQIIATKQSVRGEVSFPHATLGRRVYDYIFVPVLNQQGEVEAVAGTTRDVTERKEWEQALAQTSEELRSINEEVASTNEEMAATNEELASTNDELIATNNELQLVNQKLLTAQQKLEESERHFRYLADLVPAKISNALPNGEVTFFNKQWLDYAGMNFEELRDFGYQAMMHPDEIPDFQAKLAEAAAKGMALESEMRFKDKEGNYRWHLNIASPILNEQGEITMWVGSTTEIQRIKEEDQRKSDFIGMVSHELKTPLTSLSAILQVADIKLKKSEDKFLVEAMGKANTQVKRMTSMINGFLNISRLEAGKILIEKESFDMAQLVKETIAEARFTTNSHEISSDTCEAVIVFADRDKIGSVISNLLNNAIKYSPKDSRINVTCIAGANQVTLSVRDQGMGISHEDAGKIFDRYYRVKGNNTQHIAGFGIGLYLSAEIVHRHNGKIWVESKIGEGSTFYFTLPL